MTEGSPRTVSEWLRSRSDSALVTLLRERPDLALPVPADLGVLAGRLGNRMSVLRALERLDAFALQLIDGFVVLGGSASCDALHALVPGAAEPAFHRGVDRLRELALVWGGDEALHLAGGVREVVGSFPAGLGREAMELLLPATSATLAPLLESLGLPAERQPGAARRIAELLGDPDRLAELLARIGPAERAVLDQLAAGPPLGSVRDAFRPVSAHTADTPVRRLLAIGLLVAVDVDTVELPREVGLALRGEEPLGVVLAEPPPLPARRVAVADRVGAGAAGELLRLVEALLELAGLAPVAELRTGGVGVRELRRIARELDVAEPAVALLLEVARAAGLLDLAGLGEPEWLPTPAYDTWSESSADARWVALAGAWLGMGRAPALAGRRDERDRVLAPLSAELERPAAPALRARVLALLAELPAGHAGAADDMVARLAWEAPRSGGRLRDDLARAVLAEAELLGITGGGALASYARPLLADPDSGAAAAAALRGLLPEPLDHVLVQADLTVVAPGPLQPALAREMSLVADVESSGGATVYRITEATLRRALDAGRSAADLHELLRSRSRTPVPQALSYLIDDVARRHGALRVGTATSYLRCDDEALLSEILSARRVGALSLRRLAPTVLTSPAPVPHLLEVLRGAGYLPVAESAEGAVVLMRPDSRRAAHRPRPARFGGEPGTPATAQLAAAVREMRAGERASTSRRASVPRPLDVPGVTTSSTLSLLQDAARDALPVWLGYVNAQGSASSRIVEPLSVGGGYLRAYDHRSEETRTFALHRVTSVALAEPDAEAGG